MSGLIIPGYLFWDGSKYVTLNSVTYSPSGAAGGDLSGNYPFPTVINIQGVPVSTNSVANDGYALVSAGGTYIPTGVAPVFNVKNFGAIGNGIHDDSVAIQAAINMAASVKGVVTFPIGIYTYSSSLTIFNNIGLMGSSRQSGGSELRFTGSGSGNAINAINVGNLFIRDLFLSCTPSSGFTGNLVCCDGGNTSTFNNVRFNGPGTTCTLVSLRNTYDMGFISCSFNACNIGVYGVASNGEFANNISFVQCYVDSGGATTMWFKNPSTAWSFTGCTFEPLAGAIGNAIGSDNGIITQGLTVNGCWIGDSTNGGSWISGLFLGATITGNIINTANDGYGISLNGGFGIQITGNSFLGGIAAINLVGQGGNLNIQANTYYPTTCLPYIGIVPDSGFLQTNSNLVSYVPGGAIQQFNVFKMRAFQLNGQSFPDGVFAPVNLDTITYDPNSSFNDGYHYVVPVDGYYQVNGLVNFGDSLTMNGVGFVQAAIYVNDNVATSIDGTYCAATTSSFCSSTVNDIMMLHKNDRVSLYAIQSSGHGSANTYAAHSFMSIHYLSS